MISPTLHQEAESIVKKHIGSEVSLTKIQAVQGGSINQTHLLETTSGLYFLKTQSASDLGNPFLAEEKGLETLRSSNALRVPDVIACSQAEQHAFILMEYIDSGFRTPSFWESFGAGLANLHRNTNTHFGFEEDNFIGSLPQSNTKHVEWAEFFVVERLERQLKLAVDNGKANETTAKNFEKLYGKIQNLFPFEKPALLHGDLWSGNFLIDEEGNPCLIDPAVYYGHREMDISMSCLFGGFSLAFYRHYNEHYPLENGWEERIDIANLYPLLVHANLFGGGYINQIDGILRRFV